MQRLEPSHLVECEACHHRVNFRFRSSVATDREDMKRVYLTCPVCGASATQLQEIERLPDAPKRKIRYVYKH